MEGSGRGQGGDDLHQSAYNGISADVVGLESENVENPHRRLKQKYSSMYPVTRARE